MERVYVLKEYERAGGWEEPIINVSVFRDFDEAQLTMQEMINLHLDGITDDQISSISKDYKSFHFSRSDINDVVKIEIEEQIINENRSKKEQPKEKIKKYWPGNEPEGE